MNREISTAEFRQVLGHYPTGVAVVTAALPTGGRAGMAVGSFTSVSLDPPLVGFFPDKRSASWPKIQEAGRFCINVLAADQREVCARFASKAEDKFEDIPHEVSVNGHLVIRGAVAVIECELHAVIETGDHYLALGRVIELSAVSDRPPLLFFKGGYGCYQGEAQDDVAMSE